MALTHDSLVQTIRDRLEISEVIQRYVPLKRAGASLVACCPFHKEKTPSFHVNQRRQYFYCFGCNASGDIFDFVQKYEGKRFAEVLRGFAEQLNIALPEAKDIQFDEEGEKKKERLHQVLQLAQNFFRRELRGGEGLALSYLQERGVSEEMIEAFGLGYAPDGWGHLRDHLEGIGVERDVAIEAGLIKPSEDGQHVYDRFRHRILFPIVLPSGRLVGFGGRALRPLDGAKYLNSPESPLFQKSEILYGLHRAQASLRKGRAALIVEGYLDVIALHQAGYPEAVATLGTSFGEEHARLLKRYTDKILLLFDGDAAGNKATERALGILLSKGVSVEVLTLPEQEDPDSYLKKYGRDAFEKLLESERRPAFDAYLGYLQRTTTEDPVQIRAVTQQVLDLLQPIQDPILLDLYLKKVSQVFGIEEANLRRQMIRLVATTPAAKPPEKASAKEGPPKRAKGQDATAAIFQKHQGKVEKTDWMEEPSAQILLRILLDHKQLAPDCAIEDFVDRFESPLWRSILGRILLDHDEGVDASLLMGAILSSLDKHPSLKERTAGILMKDPPTEEYGVLRYLRDLDRFFDKKEKQRHMQRVQQRLEDLHQEVPPRTARQPETEGRQESEPPNSDGKRPIQREDVRSTAWEKSVVQRIYFDTVIAPKKTD